MLKHKHAKTMLKKKFQAAVTKRAAVLKREKSNKGKKGSLGRTLLTGAGSAIGSLVGMGREGGKVGNFFSDILGMGAYTVNSNSIMTNSEQAPRFDSGDKEFVFSHSELVTDVVSSTLFASTAFNIDPTNNSLFPMLSEMATNFEQYEFLGLVFTYKPTSGSAIASTNNSLGTVVLSTEYDVSKPLFLNKADMEAYQFSTSCEPSSLMYHPVECNPRKDILNRRYVAGYQRSQRASTYSSTGPAALSNNLNYLGRLQLGTVGSQAAVTVGELWVSYKIKLSIPRKVPSSNTQIFFHAQSATALPIGSATALFSSYNILADSTASSSAIGLSVSGTNSLVTFTGLPPRTKFIFNISYLSSGSVTAQNVTYQNMLFTAFSLLQPDGSGYTSFATPSGGTGNINQQWCVITPDNSLGTLCTITIPVPTIAGTTANWDLMIYTLPYTASQNGVNPFVLTASESSQLEADRVTRMEDRLKLYESHEFERLFLGRNEELKEDNGEDHTELSSRRTGGQDAAYVQDLFTNPSSRRAAEITSSNTTPHATPTRRAGPSSVISLDEDGDEGGDDMETDSEYRYGSMEADIKMYISKYGVDDLKPAQRKAYDEGKLIEYFRAVDKAYEASQRTSRPSSVTGAQIKQ